MRIGYGFAMPSQQIWQWEHSVPVRADAESIFVPCSALPEAEIGDAVVVTGDAGSEDRTGTITATSEGEDETFFRVAFEQSPGGAIPHDQP
jgi:hypothetical protein